MMRSVRRGSALILVLIMTLSLAGLAASAIYMAGNSGMLSRYHDKERDLTFAVETALELGRSRLQRDTSLVLYDTGYRQLLTDQAVYTSSGAEVTGLTVNLYGAYTGDTTGTNVPYITLIATVSDATGLRLARRMDLQAQSFARYGLFVNNFPSTASIGLGEIVPGRVHSNNRFIGASFGSPNPVFMDTVSVAGTISGGGQWADTISAVAGATVVPYPTTTTSLWPSAAGLASRFQALSNAGNVSVTPVSGTYTGGNSYTVADLSGYDCGYTCNATFGSRLEFISYDVDNSGAIDSTEGFFRVFNLVSDRYGYRADTIRLATNFPGTVTTQLPLATQVWANQCGAFYTIGGQREFFPVAMHSAAWVKTRIQASTYPTVSAAQATAMGAVNRTAYRTIMQQPTSRCFPFGSPYLMNVERYTTSTVCTQAFSFPWGTVSAYTWGSAPACGASQRYGGQDTTFTARVFDCVVDQTGAAGKCEPDVTYDFFQDALELGRWQAYGGTSNLPANLAPTRQTVERPYLFPISTTYNSNYRGVIYSSGRLFLSGIVRGRATLYVNGPVSLIDDLTYDADPADTTNLCRNSFGLISKDSIMVADNAINRPRVYSTSAFAGTDTSMQGGNRDFILHGIVMALGGSISAFNAAGSLRTSTVNTCPTGSSFTAAGGCMQVVGGTIMATYVAPYNSSVANSGLRPLRELDPCQMENRRPPYFPLARTRVRPLKSFDVDVRGLKSATLIRAYFTRLRGANRAAP
ncbi:MAG: hypothetical protein WC700_11560 [Gemmatimonadaceae bacterium]